MNSRSQTAFAMSIMAVLLLFLSPLSALSQTEDDVLKRNYDLLSAGFFAEQTSDNSNGLITKGNYPFAINSEESEQLNNENLLDISVDTNDKAHNQSIITMKKPGVAFALSFVLPGGGQLYNGETGKGVKMLGIATTGVALFYAFVPKEIWVYDYYSYNYGYWEEESGTPALAYAGLGVALATSVWSMIDAVNSANRINKENGFAKADEKPKLNLYLAGINSGKSITPGLKLSCSF